MLFQKYIFLILCNLTFIIHAALNPNQLVILIEVINDDANRLNSTIDKFNGMRSGIGIIKAAAKLKDDMNVVAREARKGRPDYFSWEDSQYIAIKMQDFVTVLVEALDNLVAKEPRSRPSGVRHHVPYQLEYLSEAYDSLFDALIDIVDLPDVQNLRTDQERVHFAIDRAKNVYGGVRLV